MKLNRFLAAATLATAVAVCAPQAFAAKAETFVKIEKPAAGTPVLLIKPDADLSMLTASGVTEPKVEWSDNAEKYLAEALETAVKARSYTTHAVPIESYQEPRAVQLVKLNTVVTSSIAMQEWPMMRLPTKTAFDWTLGEGTQVLDSAGRGRYRRPAICDFPARYGVLLQRRTRGLSRRCGPVGGRRASGRAVRTGDTG
ncbi:hypothetical protein OVA03_00145 [Asticcacaulis sp. SL142]|uniref:hypothetical protein n=1 Tax=Asticcacaulis sp. SL142 TaxID=2995155 RepID=UPI00226CCD81|nr:hypothetical protein [Asticcacaulis sp. SL142]WAC48382.1 hypothetical protein OVA03_00145 [Asticcacaulis sp. SL142]